MALKVPVFPGRGPGGVRGGRGACAIMMMMMGGGGLSGTGVISSQEVKEKNAGIKSEDKRREQH